jgi:hypothetical protein
VPLSLSVFAQPRQNITRKKKPLDFPNYVSHFQHVSLLQKFTSTFLLMYICLLLQPRHSLTAYITILFSDADRPWYSPALRLFLFSSPFSSSHSFTPSQVTCRKRKPRKSRSVPNTTPDLSCSPDRLSFFQYISILLDGKLLFSARETFPELMERLSHLTYHRPSSKERNGQNDSVRLKYHCC